MRNRSEGLFLWMALFGFAAPAAWPQGAGEMQPLLAEDTARVASRALEAPEVRAAAGPGRLRVVRTVAAERAKGEEGAPRVAELIVVAYERGTGVRVRSEVTSGRVVAVTPLSGRPQSSAEERVEAEALIRRKLELGADVRLVGGFVVDPPEGAPSGRYLEYHIVRGAAVEIERGVLVDLRSGEVKDDRRR